MNAVAINRLIDEAIEEAKNLPDLITKFRQIDPALAQQLTGKALLASRSPWGVLLSAIVGWLVTHYGLGWSDDTVASVVGLIILGASYGMRYITRTPITSIINDPVIPGS